MQWFSSICSQGIFCKDLITINDRLITHAQPWYISNSTSYKNMKLIVSSTEILPVSTVLLWLYDIAKSDVWQVYFAAPLLIELFCLSTHE